METNDKKDLITENNKEIKKRKKLTDVEVAKAIENSGAIIRIIADRLGAGWKEVKKYIIERKRMLDLFEQEQQKTIDLAENVIINSILEGDVATAKWYLMLKAKDRGYVEQINVNTSVDKNLLKELKELFKDDN